MQNNLSGKHKVCLYFSSPRRFIPQTSSIPQIVDPQAELRRINDQIAVELVNSPIVAEAKAMGFSENLIRAALKK